MNPLLLLPQRWLIPSVLLLFSLMISLVTLFYNIPHAEQAIEREGERAVVQMASRIQGTINGQLRRGAIEDARTEISNLGSDSVILLALLIDDRQQVMAATQYSMITADATEFLSSEELMQLEQSRQRMTGSTRTESGKDYISAVYPVVLSAEAGEIRPSSVGVLFFRYDLANVKQATIATLKHGAMVLVVFICLMSVVVWLIFHITVARRVARLVGSAQAFADGDLTRRSGVVGRDEIADVGRAFDLMAQTIAEERGNLFESEKRLRVILDNVVDGIVSMDEHGIVMALNPAAENIFGYRAAEVIGRNVKCLMPEPYQSEHDGYLNNYRTTGERKIIGIGREVEGLRADGSQVPLELWVVEVEQDNEHMFIGMLRDISERQQVDRMKKEFVSTVSHELRTPLTSIKGSLGLVSGGALGEIPAEAHSMIDIAINNSDRLMLLINDLLDIEKIESGKMDFHIEPINVMAFISDVLSANQGYADEQKVLFKVTHEEPGAMVLGDAGRLMQVMANLISNAAKYSPKSDYVEIAVHRMNGNIEIGVRDHGPGIPEAFRARIFEKFAQADSSDTRRVGGTGLGLSITRAIIECHDGRIDYESEAGVGARFFFELAEYIAEKEASDEG
jgi:PAS domain S-box-containing protein